MPQPEKTETIEIIADRKELARLILAAALEKIDKLGFVARYGQSPLTTNRIRFCPRPLNGPDNCDDKNRLDQPGRMAQNSAAADGVTRAR